MFLLPLSLLLAGTPAFALDLPAPVQDAIADAAAAGVPTATLERKASEGLAKGVPPDRVAVVLRHMQGELASAADLLASGGHPASDEAVIAGAAALQAGASSAVVERLGRLAPGVRVLALQGMSDLLLAGFSPDQSLRLVESAARSRRPDLALSDLSSASSALLLQGVPHADAAQRIGAEIAAGRSGLAALSGQGNGASNGNNGNNGNNGGNGNNGNNGNGNPGNSGNGNNGGNGN